MKTNFQIDREGMQKLTAAVVTRGYDIASRRPVLTLAIVAALVFMLIYGPALILGVKDAWTTPKIEKAKQEAATEKTAASQEKIAAGELDTERKAEDQHRAQEIAPQRKRAADRLAEARRTREALENDYEKTNQNPRRPPVDDRDLRRRNCSDLATILPGHRIAGCQ